MRESIYVSRAEHVLRTLDCPALVFFISAVDPRFLSTLESILKTPERGGLTVNHLVYRYDVQKSNDGVGGEEGAFRRILFSSCETPS